MEIELDVEGQHAVLTLSSSAPLNRALLCASLEWSGPQPPYRSLAQRDALASLLADIACQVGTAPIILDCAERLPTHTGYERTGKAKPRAKAQNASTGVSSPSTGDAL